MRLALERFPIDFLVAWRGSGESEPVTCAVTLSLGVAATLGREPYTPHELIHRADRAMYRAKNEDRNCVRVWTEDAPPTVPVGRDYARIVRG
jgi:GGDEF domain-containing protein